MDNEIISIIVPCYNVEKYIERCVTSLVNQTYINIEIILVDDGSTDSTSELCESYKRDDSRIKVIHKKNGGLSDARNAGMKVATGNYFFFLDSDDFISTDTIKFLYKNLLDKDADISTCAHINYFENKSTKNRTYDNKNFVYETEDALKNLLYEKNITTSAWGKLYKRNLFDNIEYPKGKICEDLPTTYLLFAKSKRVSINSIPMYYYLIRKDSIIHSKFNKKRLDALDFAEEETKFIKEKFPNIINAAISREFMEAVYISTTIPCSIEYKDARKKIKNILKKYRKNVLIDSNVNMNEKVYAYMSYLNIFGIKLTYTIKKILDYFNLRGHYEH